MICELRETLSPGIILRASTKFLTPLFFKSLAVITDAIAGALLRDVLVPVAILMNSASE